MRAPETPGQARVWEAIKTQYLRQGLCHRCAALAAWGHQTGMTMVDRPCTVCRPVVAGFPIPAGRDWRKASRTMLRTGSVLSPAVASVSACADANDNTSAREAVVS